MGEVVLRDLTDEEIKNLTDEDRYEFLINYQKNGVPVRATVKGLLEELGIKFDDLSDFILGLEIGVCNNANRTDNQIYINRKNSPMRDNILINLNEDYDVPDVIVQIQIGDDFIHEEAYHKDGMLLYKA